MHHRVIPLLVSRASISATVTLPTTFSFALQAAASRAWSRRVSTHIPTTNASKSKGNHSNTRKRGPTTTDEPPGRSSHLDPSSVSPAGKRSLDKDDIDKPGQHTHHVSTRPRPLSTPSSTPHRGLGASAGDKDGASLYSQPHSEPSIPGTAHTKPVSSISPRAPHAGFASHGTHQGSSESIDVGSLPRPSTPNVLCQNLLRLISNRKPIPSLPAIVDYHNSFPELHSTDSYNLVLTMAIEHAAYTIFRSILQAMRAALIPRNRQTWQLETRYLVHTGSWNQAWEQARQYPCDLRPQQGESPIPLPIWLELFGMPRRSLTPLPAKQRKRLGGESVQEDTQQMPLQESAVWNQRLRLLFDNAPLEMADFEGIQPHTIRGVVWCLLKLQHREEALSITESYFRSLPSSLSPRDSACCTDIINLHISFGATGKGMVKFTATRTILQTLLDTKPTLRPDSNTLFLLLGPLRSAKWCAKKAQSVVREFCAQWGSDIADSRVKRRVVNLALKGGRPDIAEEFSVSRKELEEDSLRDKPAPTVLPPRRELFRGAGRERVLWSHARARIKAARASAERASST